MHFTKLHLKLTNFLAYYFFDMPTNSDAPLQIKINLFVRSISRIDDVRMVRASKNGLRTYYHIYNSTYICI